MSTTRVSSKFQIVIPKDIRASIAVHPGQTFQIVTKGGIISLVPEKPIAQMRGIARGVKATGFREKRERI